MKIDINKAKKNLIKGNLVIFPTETVYGLGGDATKISAIKKIYKIKKRPINNPIICHFKDIKSIEKNFIFNDIDYKLAYKYWPGPLTLILKRKNISKISPLISNNSKYVGCRIPNHPIAKSLLKVIDFPIAAPSANISKKLSSTNIDHISTKVKNKVFILDGGSTPLGMESTVIKTNKNSLEILRQGSITHEEIKKKFPKINILLRSSNNLSPGQQKKHYSPNLPIRINVKSILKNEVLLNFGKNNLKSKIFELNLSPKGDLSEASKQFYNYLHILDKVKCSRIAVAPIPNNKLGAAINDRLKRASSKN